MSADDEMHNGGWTGPVIQSRLRNALLSDAWLATAANAYDVQARTSLLKAKQITPDTYDRRKQIERHKSQAHYYALHAAAFRELLYGRQRADKAAG